MYYTLLYFIIYINFTIRSNNSKNRHGVTLPPVKYYTTFITIICNETDSMRILCEHDITQKCRMRVVNVGSFCKLFDCLVINCCNKIDLGTQITT